MANTHDYSLANDTGANFRSDLNTLLGEVQASNIGGSAPSQAVTGKLWYDSTNGIIKVYDGSAWVAISSTGKMIAMSIVFGS